jgi:sterol desaturase/sphingolipid hydroxylase (fatty acid hydroxylase superfamily)
VTNKDEHKRTRKPNIKNYAFVFLILDRLLGSERRKRREKGSGRDVNTAGQLDVTGRRLTAQSPKKTYKNWKKKKKKKGK